MFGENFTTVGLLEIEVNIGDTFRVGSAEVMVTQPRMPCYKLGLRFGRSDIIKRFLASERSGFYLAVLKEGDVGAGDEFEPLATDTNNVKVRDITRLYTSEKDNADLLRRAIRVEALPDSWREYFVVRLERLTK
jgi:MOSC domain-containing protein YiiM